MTISTIYSHIPLSEAIGVAVPVRADAAHIPFIALLLAHLIADFLLQSSAGVRAKAELSARAHLTHALTHGLVAFPLLLAVMDQADPGVAGVYAAIGAVAHAVIDIIKDILVNYARRTGRNAGPWSPGAVFLIDQLAHVLVLAMLASALNSRGAFDPYDVVAYAFAALAGLILTVRVGEFAVRFLMAAVMAQHLGERDGADNAGAVIGRLERFLIYLLVVSGMPLGVGFLIAAKSILRFGEANNPDNRAQSEYIIIGTLASFAWGLAAASLTAWILTRFTTV